MRKIIVLIAVMAGLWSCTDYLKVEPSNVLAGCQLRRCKSFIRWVSEDVCRPDFHNFAGDGSSLPGK